MAVKYIFVEDSHGPCFHFSIINYLYQKGFLSGDKPRIKRFPAKKCNRALVKKIKGVLVGIKDWKILFVIDSEYRGSSVWKDLLKHFRSRELDSIRALCIDPMHEAWLCIGLGGKRNKCRSRPKDEIEKIIGKPYDKYMLCKIVKNMDRKRLNSFINNLLNEQDFREYIDHLKWLINDP